MIELRPYQEKAISDVYAALREHMRVGLMVPTGGGKTIIAAEIVRHAIENGRRVMFMVDRLPLIDQTSSAFDHYGIDHGIVQANHWRYRPHLPVQVCSIQTIARRHNIPDADLIIVDEFHTQYESLYRLMDRWNAVKFLGLSATPFTKGLGKKWEKLIVPITTKELIEQGYLVPFRCYGAQVPDLKGVSTSAGDYNQKQLATRVNQRAIVADVVHTWKRLGENRKTICFAVDIAHAESLMEEFNAHGIPAGMVHSYQSDEERQRNMDWFINGDMRVMCNVDVLTKGFDHPAASCLIMARPTKSLTVHIQMIGRVLRTAPGKKDALILDHGGNILRLGFPTDPLPTKLHTGEKGKQGRKKDEGKKASKCPSCGLLKEIGQHVCPQCGFAPEKQPRVAVIDGRLVELEHKKENKPKKVSEYSKQEKRAFYQMLLHIAIQRGYKRGWAAYAYKAKFGSWPDLRGAVGPMEPSEDVIRFVKYLAIRRAKGRQKTSHCKWCGTGKLHIRKGKGPHAGQAVCSSCGKHNYWIGKEEYKKLMSK